MKKILIFTILITALLQVNGATNQTDTMQPKNETIYLAGGCFWGTEHFVKLLTGVKATSVGYANSSINEPTYEQVCSGETNAAEAVCVEYDPSLVSLTKIITLFFKTIDPTSLNKQGNDRGTQYRTGIYTTSDAQLAEVKTIVAQLATEYKEELVIETALLENFYNGELYHQDYLDKNPGGYCHIGPELFELARKN